MSFSRIATLATQAARRPLDHLRWTPPQVAFLTDPSREKLLRTGQQLGKTHAGVAEAIWRCTGEHPYLATHEPPIEAWMVCVSWSQSLVIQRKVWDLVPKDQISSDTEFDPVRGFRGKHPAVKFRSGSILRFKTAHQHALDLASATLHYVGIDEPTEPRIYHELMARTRRTNGVIGITLTPINGPVEWLRERCEQGIVSDHHYPLTVENITPVGASRPLRLEDGTWMDQAWIEELRRRTWAPEAPVVLDGEWEVRVDGRVFEAWHERTHVTTDLPLGACKLALGIDHGDGAEFSQVALLVAVQEGDSSRSYDRIWVLDEYISSGTTTPDMDAGAIIEMLRRHSLHWGSLDWVHGDRRYAGRRGGSSKKSNLDLAAALCRELRMPANAMRPKIRTVKRGDGHGRGSVDRGVRYIHHATVRPNHFHVHPRCSRLIASLNRWDYRDNEWKHAIDALRYTLDPWIFSRRTSIPRVRQG